MVLSIGTETTVYSEYCYIISEYIFSFSTIAELLFACMHVQAFRLHMCTQKQVRLTFFCFVVVLTRGGGVRGEQALVEEFAHELSKKEGKLDSDPHLWMPVRLEYTSATNIKVSAFIRAAGSTQQQYRRQ